MHQEIFAGVDFGGTKIAVCLANKKGIIFRKKVIVLKKGKKTNLGKSLTKLLKNKLNHLFFSQIKTNFPILLKKANNSRL